MTKTKIYTRTGDEGTTSLFSGQRVAKDNAFIEALGKVDEANCAIGLAVSFIPKQPLFSEIIQQLETIQHALFDVGAALATPRTCHQDKKLEKTRFDKQAISSLEKWIDSMETELPSLKTFILPGGHSSGATLHLARSIVRNAERLVVPLFQQKDVSQEVLIYLNRLSDYLFIASRFLNQQCSISETPWKSHRSQ